MECWEHYITYPVSNNLRPLNKTNEDKVSIQSKLLLSSNYLYIAK